MSLLLDWFPSSNTSLLLILLLFPISLLLITRRLITEKSHLPPSPPKLPLIGNLHQLGSLPHRSLCALSEKHGPLMLLHLGRVPTLVVSSADTAQEILRTHDHIFANRPLMEVPRILLYGSQSMSFSPYGEYWRQVRKLCVTHLLSTRAVQSFGLVREEEVAFMIAKISRATSSSLVDMSEILYSFANDIVCRVVSGKFGREGGRNGLFRQLIDANSALLGEFHVADYFPVLGWLDVLFGVSARAKKNSQRWDAMLDEVLKEHVDRRRGDRPHGPADFDFVDVLLSLQKDPNEEFAIRDEHIKALLVDMLAAGTDTTYITLEWSLAELVRKPETMKKLRDEVRSIAKRKAMVTEEDLSKMSYLKAVLKEVLRLHPPAPLLLPRESMQDCQLQGYEVSKKTRVIINAWAIGRDPRSWESPEEFQPERFFGTSLDFKGKDFQLIPFGAGRRICPGMNFAVSSVELALANLMYQFDWQLPDGMRREDFDMSEEPGLTTRIKQRLCLIAKTLSC